MMRVAAVPVWVCWSNLQKTKEPTSKTRSAARSDGAGDDGGPDACYRYLGSGHDCLPYPPEVASLTGVGTETQKKPRMQRRKDPFAVTLVSSSPGLGANSERLAARAWARARASGDVSGFQTLVKAQIDSNTWTHQILPWAPRVSGKDPQRPWGDAMTENYDLSD